MDIRRFFQGLHIPDGGVHIVGGENGDAFIAFGSDEDARQAMGRDGNLIKNSRVKLLLSSRNEMQRVIDNVRIAMAISLNNPALAPATGAPNIGGGGVGGNVGMAVGGGGGVGGGIGGVGVGIAGINQGIKKDVQGIAYVAQQQPQVIAKQPLHNQPGGPVAFRNVSGPAQQQQQPPMGGGGGYQGGPGAAGQVGTHPQFSSGPLNNQNSLGGYGGGGMQQQQPPPKMMHPSEGPNNFQARQQPSYRARSRSRSPPIRAPSSLPSDAIGGGGGGGHSMQSGLMGSLQQQQPQPQPPIPNQMYGQNNGYNQQQPLPPNNGGGFQQSNNGPYDNGNNSGPGGNFYSRPPQQQQQQQYGEDRWTSGSGGGGGGPQQQGGPMNMGGGGGGNLGQSVGMGGGGGGGQLVDSYQQQANQNMYPRGGDPRGDPRAGGDPRNVGNQPPYNQQQQQQYPPQNSSGPMGYGNNNNMGGPLPPQQQQQPPMNQVNNNNANNARLFDVQLWNLPVEVRSYDLLSFFAPLYLTEEHVKIFYDERRLPSGMAVVSFSSARDMDAALGYNGRYLLGNSITVRPMTDLAADRGNLGGGGVGIGTGAGGGGNVSNGGYGGQHVNNNNSNFMPPNSASQLPSNEPSSAYIDPNSNYPQGGGGGFRASPGPQMDMPYTNNRPPPPGGPFQGGGGNHPMAHHQPQSQRYLPQQGMPGGPGGPPGGGGGGPHRPGKQLVLFMKGLPFGSCTPRDVEDFFQNIPLVNVEIERDPRTGKPSGNAFVEFDNKHDYDRAKKFNMRHMGHRYIELIPLHKLMMGGGGKGGGDRGGPHGGGPPRPVTFCVNVKGLSPSISSQDLKNYFGVNGARPYAVHIMLTPNMLNAGEAFLEFLDKEGYKRALKKDGAELGRDRLLIQPVPYEVVMGAIVKPKGGGGFGGGPGGPGGGFNKGGGGPHSHVPPPPPPPPQRAPAPFEDRAATLIALDCSSKAVEEDYCLFFEKFGIGPERVKLAMNGHTGAVEATISFHSRADAAEAMRTANGKFFFGRTMKLEFL